MSELSTMNQFRVCEAGALRSAVRVVTPFARGLLFSLCTLLIGIADGSAQMCANMFLISGDRLENLGSAFVQVVNKISFLSPQLVNAKATPTWQDFNTLETLIRDLRRAKASLTTPEQVAEFNALAVQIASELESYPNLKDLAMAHRWHQQSKQYKPAEYKLKLQYQKLISKLNHELPRGARIPIQRLPVDLRRERINQDAREFMAEFEKAFARRFPTTGYKTYEEYEAHLRSSDDPQIKKAIEMLDKGQIEVMIRRPESGRFWIPKVGFQNQYVTGSSKGFYRPYQRQSAEMRLYDIVGEEAYRAQDPEFMPKYGTFRPAPESGVSFSNLIASSYGPDLWVLRLSDIQDRLTFTPFDSLDVGEMQGPLEHWSATFIPWKYRLLMVEFMRQGLTANAMVRPDGRNLEGLVKNRFAYWETQILGAVDLSNVASFQFTEHPPTGAFLLDLLKHEIPIYDARAWPPVQWHPSASQIDSAKASGM